MYLARRSLFHDKMRLALSVVAVALSIMLILILNGFLSGISSQLAAYLDSVPGSVVVARQGAPNRIARSALLPPGATDSISRVAGVARVVPIIAQFFIVDMRGTKFVLNMVGYDPALGGGPWQLAAGREPQTDTEAVLDSVMANTQNIGVGDSLSLANRTFTVVGLSRGTITQVYAYIFVRKAAAEALLLAPGVTSFVVVSPAAGVTVDDLRSRLRSVLPDTIALPKSQVIADTTALYGSVYNSPLRLMTGIAFLVGLLVVGLVIYTATIERKQEYGVLKAIGAHKRLLYTVILAQALTAAVTGTFLGIGLAFAVAQLIMALRPAFAITLEPSSIVLALVAGLVMALLAAFVPARTVAKLAPADVFRV